MDILTSPGEMHTWRWGCGGTVGFVPTMGYLHEGHLALVRRSVAENDVTAASIFVNPLQFGPGEDFERYPRDEERDLALLEQAGVAAVYMPRAEAMYPEGFQTSVETREISLPLEGASRPGHFAGVTTVVLKLLNAVMPDRAYFGKKDAQQLRVIQRMVRDLDVATEIVACEIVREPDGLAMSSRNVYLSAEEREAATVLSQALFEARDVFGAGERNAAALRDGVQARIAAESLAQIQYVSLADGETLEELAGRVERPALLSLAVRFGATRLIDNVELAL
jgi:pantoate--beta-alanine ligase